MAKAHTLMQTVPTTTVTGSMTSNTVSEWNPGQMVPNTRDTTSTVKRKERENSHLPMVATMRENSSKTKYVVTVSTTGQMENNTTENGVITKCTVREL